MAKSLKLSRGYKTLVDNYVYRWAKQYKWCALPSARIVYAVRSTGRNNGHKTVMLHHCIIGRPLAGVVDHIDGNGLNNQRRNLRIVSNSENLRNSYRHRNGHRAGTHIRCRNNRYEAIITGVKHKSIGTFSSRNAAISALEKYNEKA